MSARAGGLTRAVALGRFAVAANLGRWSTRGGLLMGAAVMALGSVLSVQQNAGWRFDDDFGFMGFFVMALFAIRSGLEEQRELGLTTFATHNLASRTEHAAGVMLAALGMWLVVCAAGFVSVFIASGGDAGAATWHTAAWSLRLLLLLGFVPMVEAVASIRLPLILPAFFYLGLVVVLTLILAEERAFELIILTERGNFASYVRLASQAAAALLFTSMVFVTAYASHPTVESALRKLVPDRH